MDVCCFTIRPSFSFVPDSLKSTSEIIWPKGEETVVTKSGSCVGQLCVTLTKSPENQLEGRELLCCRFTDSACGPLVPLLSGLS